MSNWSYLLTNQTFRKISSEYRRSTGFDIAFVVDGKIQMGGLRLPGLANARDRLFVRMEEETVRWGEPNINMLNSGAFLWCVPLCINNEAGGGFFSGCEGASFKVNTAEKIREASWGLLDLCARYNLVNTSLMQLNRMVAQTAAKQAEAIHQSKHILYQNPRDLFLIEEREILSAIKTKNIEKAREIINRILVGVYHIGGADFGVLKMLILEMVVQMYRAAVSEGANPETLLGVNSIYLAEFLKVETEDELNRWLLQWLESFVNVNLAAGGAYQHSLTPAILYIKRNLDKPISRDQVARVCNLSPSYFSHLIKERTGYTYSDLLNRFRIEHACALLEQSSLSASDVAYACGFNDQSYFTKVFKKVTGQPPGQYRSGNRHLDKRPEVPK
jgi:AraC-like DNA-binding protein